MKAIRLRTDYLTEPLGLGNSSPRFYWNCEDIMKQTAYQIIAKRNDKIVWNSGKVDSPSMTHICYEGEPLRSRDRVNWSVKIWDENGEGNDISTSWFEMGLLTESDWQAKWITGNYKPRKNERYPVDCFRKKFACNQEIRQARLYITACGLYEANLNGHRVGNFQLAPGSTDYRKRLQYQTYDVTALLQGENRLEIFLADGWYRGSIGCFGVTNVFGRQTKLLAQLEIVDKNGNRTTLITDENWDWSNDGPIRFADLKDGEIVQAGMQPSYCGKAVVCKESKVLVAADNVQPTCHEEFRAKLIITPTGKKVLDFGQNIAGFLKFKVQGDPGQRIRLLMGEILDENGEFTQKNMQGSKPVREMSRMQQILLITGNGDKIAGEKQPTPRQEILFYCSGAEDQYQTKFAVFGFRYALLETDIDIDPADFCAVAVYSDMEQTGFFTCSHEKINQLYRNTVWSMKGNFLDVPTDCPTRERLAWTGDAQIFFDTGAYLMDTAAFFRKWMRDVQDNQFKNGKISAVIPYNGASMVYDNTSTSVGWNDCAVLLPYRYWKRFDDRVFLKENYPVMRKLAMFMIHNAGHKNKKDANTNPYNKYVYEKGVQLGEWLEPEEFQDKIAAGATGTHTEEATAYMHYTMTHMVEVAAYLGKTEDEALFREYAEGAKKAYQHLFLKEIPDTDRQAKLIRPLYFGIVADDQKAALQERLVKAVENRNYRIGTGFLSTPFVLATLTQSGRTDMAYKMLENELAPGWLYEVDQGATTVWENWEGSASYNHYSPGAVCQWLFDTACGIRISGENRFQISPQPGGTLTYAKAGYLSPYGLVESGWEIRESGTEYTITVPANCTADVALPGGERKTLSAGTTKWKI